MPKPLIDFDVTIIPNCATDPVDVRMQAHTHRQAEAMARAMYRNCQVLRSVNVPAQPYIQPGLREQVTAELRRVRAALRDVPAAIRGPKHQMASRRCRDVALFLLNDRTLDVAALKLAEAKHHAAAYL